MGIRGGVMWWAALARHIVVLALLTICAVAAMVATSAIALSKPTPPPVTAVDARTGHELPQDPFVHHGEQIILTTPGFAPGSDVVVALVGYRHLATVTASSAGVAVYEFTVPSSLLPGHYTLIISAPAALRPGTIPTTGSSHAHSDPQVIEVTMPYDPPWPFRLAGKQSSTPSSQSESGGGKQRPPASTGTDVLELVIIAIWALGTGSIVVWAARRRQRPRRA